MSSSAKRYTAEQEAAMRAAGLIPKTVWVFDPDAPGFRERCLEESRLLAEVDATDPTIEGFSEAALLDLAEELDRLEK